ncbi:metalloprotease [Streptomyces sp. CB02923]|uniref:M4 family metallopeptidase n=1 Tax=Streptomyces sp. CB02923 TaxID=1718985 RepID=UPI00093BDF14|nr:M4 family metallopeptidase [Streptomyces sp. CB02923]OKH99094.1 metalloprotease [Streptomyces sp. CB02923]
MGAAALLIPAVPAGAAPAARPAAPGEVVPGQRTATPALVDGIREAAEATGSPADAARGHLAAREGRYHIGDPGRDLRTVQTVDAGGHEIVRLQQKHRGVDVLGGQYVVRMEHQGGERVVTGTSGKYFTGLRTGVEPAVDGALAVERAVDAATDQLLNHRLPRPDAQPLTGTDRGLVVLPRGAGVLTRHVTVRGTHPVTGVPVLHEVYVDAQAGYPVLQYSGIKTFRPPETGTAAPAPQGRRAGASALRAEEPGVKGSGVKYDGKTVELPVAYEESRTAYVLRDHTRMAGTSKNTLSTWDARGKDVGDVSGPWPYDILEFASPTPAFGPEATEAGAVDAHWAAGKVYDYYRDRHGRDSLDGRGMAVNSLVGVTQSGQPYINAFWDGSKMVYGAGDAEYRTLSAGLDVVGHEMTHGVVEHSANLVYAGQSGALNEAVADYFGNAIETDTYGIPMDSPDSGLLGETLCRTKPPGTCATRDLNDGRTTSKSFLGVSLATDNGGVHLNSTIFAGALWDLREDLGQTLADKIVYKALTEYLTPLDGFTEGRAAVLAAARDLHATEAQLRTAERAFSAHGVVPGWELAMGVDSDPLLGRINTDGSSTGAGGGWWAASKSNEVGTEPYSVWAGRADGTGALKLMSPNDGRYHVHPATDGRTVVWLAYHRRSMDILARPIAGGPVKTLWSGRRGASDLRVEGDVVVFETRPRPVGESVRYVRLSDPTAVKVNDEPGLRTVHPSIAHGRIAYGTIRRDGPTRIYGVETLDLKTGKRTQMGQLGTPARIGQTAITGKHVFWLVPTDDDSGRTALRRAGLDGTAVTDLSPGDGPDALRASELVGTDEAVTVTASTPDTVYRNETLSKLWQFSADSGQRSRVSCNRGEQAWPAMPGGRQVVWVDGTAGYTDLVTRTRPAGRCG